MADLIAVEIAVTIDCPECHRRVVVTGSSGNILMGGCEDWPDGSPKDMMLQVLCDCGSGWFDVSLRAAMK